MQPHSAVSPFDVQLSSSHALVAAALATNSPLLREPAQDESLRQILVNLIGERQFDHWFRGKTRLAVENEVLVVYAANPFLQKWLQKQHRAALVQVARSVIGPSACVRFDVDASLAMAAKSASDANLAIDELQTVPGVLGEGSENFRPSRQPVGPGDTGATAARERPGPQHPGSQSSSPQRPGRRFAELSDFCVGDCKAAAA